MHLLLVLECIRFPRTPTLKQVTILSGLLNNSSMKCVSLLKNLLRGRPILDETREARFRTGLLGRLAESIEDEAGSKGADGDVEATLYVSQQGNR